MPEIRCVRIKLKPNSLDRVHNWADELKCRKDEVLEALMAEGVTLEAAFLEKASDGDYLIYVIKADKLSKADNVTKKSNRPIDEFHRDFKSVAFENGERLEQLICFEEV
jgi:Family of unknown function (DUF6176)